MQICRIPCQVVYTAILTVHTDGRPTSIGFKFGSRQPRTSLPFLYCLGFRFSSFSVFIHFAFTEIAVPDGWGKPTTQDTESPLDRALAALRELGYKDLVESDLDRLIPPDEYEEELVVMADVRAYFQVAYKVRAPIVYHNVSLSPNFCLL